MFHSLWQYCKQNGNDILREVLISIAFSAIAATLFTFYFDGKIDQRVAQRQILYDFSRTFFDNPKYRDISIAIEEQYLFNRGNIRQPNGGRFSDYEVDDYLGLLFDMWTYEQNGLVPRDLVADQFGYYFCITSADKEIQDYRAYLRSLGFTGNGAWDYLDKVAEQSDFANTDCKSFY